MSATSNVGVGQPALGGFLAGELDGGLRLVEPDGGEALLGEVQRRRGLTAAGVEHVAVELARVDERLDLGLRLADAPRRPGAGLISRLAPVGGFEHLFFCGLVMPHVYQLIDICQDG